MITYITMWDKINFWDTIEFDVSWGWEESSGVAEKAKAFVSAALEWEDFKEGDTLTQQEYAKLLEKLDEPTAALVNRSNTFAVTTNFEWDAPVNTYTFQWVQD